MSNHWGIYRDTLCKWSLRVPFSKGSERDALQWVSDIASLGAELEIALFRDDQGHVLTAERIHRKLEQTLLEQCAIDSFAFSRGFKRCSSRLCFFEHGELVDRVVGDVAELLKEVEPSVADQAWLPANGCEALSVGGFLVKLDGSSNPQRIAVDVRTRCDIWLPWVPGHINPDFQRRHDNREIARCHTPRLNRFLGFLRTLADEHDGEWTYSNMIEYAWIDSMANSEGVNLEPAL